MSIGRGVAYVLSRLDRDGHAELAAKVRSGETTAHAAAKAVGYRKRSSNAEKAEAVEPALPAPDALVAQIMQRDAIEPAYSLLVARALIKALPVESALSLVGGQPKPQPPKPQSSATVSVESLIG